MRLEPLHLTTEELRNIHRDMNILNAQDAQYMAKHPNHRRLLGDTQRDMRMRRRIQEMCEERLKSIGMEV